MEVAEVQTWELALTNVERARRADLGRIRKLEPVVDVSDATARSQTPRSDPGRESWRRGWDSDSAASLTARKLLIFRDAPAALTARTAVIGYSLGTDALRLVLLLSLLSPLTLAQHRKTFTVPFELHSGLILLKDEVNRKPAALLLDTGSNRRRAGVAESRRRARPTMDCTRR